jgi:DNA primase
LKAGEEDAFDEQLRLHGERERIKERLASLVGTE